jgi:hypothetical protein
LLVYGKHSETGELKHISLVPNGIRCYCICPSDKCNVPLIAVHPKEHISAHFRHSPDANGQERECADPEGANESIVHSVAKKAIGELSKLWLIEAKKGRGLYKGRQIPPYLLYPKGAWDISAAKVEDHQFSSRYVPDVLCKTSAGLLAIEVYYRHRVDQTKRERLVQDGFA